MEEKVYCPECYRELKGIDIDWIYCPYCGALIDEEDIDPADEIYDDMIEEEIDDYGEIASESEVEYGSPEWEEMAMKQLI